MYSYYVRPAYNSDELIIGFLNSSEDQFFSNTLKDFLKNSNIPILEKVDSFDDVFYTLDSPYGSFEMSIDSWGSTFLHGGEKTDIINYLDKLLLSSGVFMKVSPPNN